MVRIWEQQSSTLNCIGELPIQRTSCQLLERFWVTNTGMVPSAKTRTPVRPILGTWFGMCWCRAVSSWKDRSLWVVGHGIWSHPHFLAGPQWPKQLAISSHLSVICIWHSWWLVTFSCLSCERNILSWSMSEVAPKWTFCCGCRVHYVAINDNKPLIH